MDDYKQLRMIENIKNFKEMETAYKANLKLCKYQEQQINKLATCVEQIKDICNTYLMEYMVNNGVKLLTTKILQIIEDKDE